MLALAMRREHTAGRSNYNDPNSAASNFDQLQHPFGVQSQGLEAVVLNSRLRDNHQGGGGESEGAEAEGEGELQEFVDIAQVQQLLQQQQQHHQQQHQQQQQAVPGSTSCVWGAVYPPPPPAIAFPHPTHHHPHHHHHHPTPGEQRRITVTLSDCFCLYSFVTYSLLPTPYSLLHPPLMHPSATVCFNPDLDPNPSDNSPLVRRSRYSE